MMSEKDENLEAALVAPTDLVGHREAAIAAWSAAKPLPPPHRRRRIPPRVMHEEDYVDAVEHIIRRDYFPDLPRLRATKRLVDAKERGDTLSAKRAKYELDVMTPVSVAGGLTPMRGSSVMGTPMSEAGGLGSEEGRREKLKWYEAVESARRGGSGGGAGGEEEADVRVVELVDGRKVRVNLRGMMLDKFQSIYTSEDNASFEAIVNEEKEKLRKSESWMEASASQHNRAILDAGMEALQDGDARQQKMLHTAAEPRPALLFDPSYSVLPAVQPYEHKEVMNRNTRFPTALQDSTEQLDKQREKLQRMREAQEEERDLDQMVRRGNFGSTYGDSVGANRSGTGEYKFERTPMIAPGRGADCSPLMSWGAVESTPMLLGAGGMGEEGAGADHIGYLAEIQRSRLAGWTGESDVGRGFEVQAMPAKEEAANRLADRLKKSSKEGVIAARKKLLGIGSTSSRSRTPRSSLITPITHPQGMTPRSTTSRWSVGGSVHRLPASMAEAAASTPLLKAMIEGTNHRARKSIQHENGVDDGAAAVKKRKRQSAPAGC